MLHGGFLVPAISLTPLEQGKWREGLTLRTASQGAQRLLRVLLPSAPSFRHLQATSISIGVP